MMEKVSRWFGIAESGTSISKEIRAGITTFLAMAYILFVNPQILGLAIIVPGVSDIHAQLLSATALAAAAGSILMGLLARVPIAVAPGMGLNAYFTYTVVLGQGLPWQTALGAVFVSGVIFLILSVSGLRESIVNAIPISIKRASAAGIGMFLAIIGCRAGGLIAPNSATIIGMGEMKSITVLLFICGLVFTGALLLRRIPGAILLGVITISLCSVIFKLDVYDGRTFGGFSDGIFRLPILPHDLFGAFDIVGAMKMENASIVFTFLFVAFFDTAGTLIGLSEVVKLSEQEGRVPRAGYAFATDAIATTIGATLGTSTTTAYMESAAGIEDGGKTGLVAVVVGVLFLVAMLFWPLAASVPAVATAPALIIIGTMLMESIGKIDWKDFRESLPAFMTMFGMPITFSIANGISLGVLTYVLLSIFSKNGKSVHPVMYGLAIVIFVRYVWLSGS